MAIIVIVENKYPKPQSPEADDGKNNSILVFHKSAGQHHIIPAKEEGTGGEKLPSNMKEFQLSDEEDDFLNIKVLPTSGNIPKSRIHLPGNCDSCFIPAKKKTAILITHLEGQTVLRIPESMDPWMFEVFKPKVQGTKKSDPGPVGADNVAVGPDIPTDPG